MPVAISLRIDDDLAQMLRKRAEEERCSINRLIDHGMREYLERRASAGRRLRDPDDATRNILASLPDHLEVLERAMKPLDHQETPADFYEKTREAFREVKTILVLLAAAMNPDTVPKAGAVREKVRV
ncbi:MAG TPA: hypothetical protein VMA98_11710 [Candidatus Acidoferrales bacterium]|nr:hypothetical protein [Candidatus Acidoferrales bacterium]